MRIALRYGNIAMPGEFLRDFQVAGRLEDHRYKIVAEGVGRDRSDRIFAQALFNPLRNDHATGFRRNRERLFPGAFIMSRENRESGAGEREFLAEFGAET